MNDQAPAGGHQINVTGNNSGQIVAGNQNIVTMNVNAEQAGITEEDRDAMRALLDELRAAVRTDVPEPEKEAAQQEVRALAKEVEADEPDAGRIKRAIEWIGDKLPVVAEWAGKAILSPFVVKVMDAAGTAITRAIGG
ncbi:MAG TPA: hypothetical protein VHI13_06060 [Candidatus Kapabacteria bacterium]|nr:hypothetical protein [Candidatus Kapabacteria bacterium]